MANTPRLVLGTHNQKKGKEMTALLAPHRLELLTLTDFPETLEVVEDGNSFAENAALKATQQAVHLGQWVLGEDSGLVVDALGGAPGIYSARFAGPQATDADNNRQLLEKLGDTPLEKRTAHYVCHMTLSDPQGNLRAECESYCQGRIQFAASGSAGFGYDPLFEIVEYHRTFGDLGEEIKSTLSHRARAMRQLIPQLAALVRTGQWE